MDSGISLRIADDIVISEKFTIDNFKGTRLYKNQELNIFFWVRENFYIRNHTFYIGFLFGKAKIKQLQLYCIDKTIVNEIQRKMFNDKFVEQIIKDINCVGEKIKSIGNKREGISLIIINF